MTKSDREALVTDKFGKVPDQGVECDVARHFAPLTGLNEV